MKKIILITNDDGIAADGLARLARAATRFGEVWVVAPESERSAASHSITLRHNIDVIPHDYPVRGVKAFSCSGTPADCVRVGSLGVMSYRPDMVLTGINYGYNAATDVQYSATVGAAFEGAFQGYPSIAFSEGASDCHEVTDEYLDVVLEEAMSYTYTPGEILNINFPSCKLTECKGILRDLKVSKGAFYRDNYVEKEQLPDGGKRYMVKGVYNEDAEPGTDFRALVDGYISIGTVRNAGW